MREADRCGFTVVDRDGIEQPCDRTASGWRWYQDVEHEDMLDVACLTHENEGGRRLHTAEARIAAAQSALVATGYFTAAEVGPDIAPRIFELVAALGAAVTPTPQETCEHTPEAATEATAMSEVTRTEQDAIYDECPTPDDSNCGAKTWCRGCLGLRGQDHDPDDVNCVEHEAGEDYSLGNACLICRRPVTPSELQRATEQLVIGHGQFESAPQETKERVDALRKRRAPTQATSKTKRCVQGDEHQPHLWRMAESTVAAASEIFWCSGRGLS